MSSYRVPPIIIMGIQGSGKTTIGELLARRLGVPFVDGDTLHSRKNKEWMASGRALSDTCVAAGLSTVWTPFARFEQSVPLT